jgi:hypothetical protein
MTKLERRIQELEASRGQIEEAPTINVEKLTQAQRIRILAALDAGTFPESLSDEDLTALVDAKLESDEGSNDP